MLLAHWERALSPACLSTLERTLERREPSGRQPHAAGPPTGRTVAERTHSRPPAPRPHWALQLTVSCSPLILTPRASAPLTAWTRSSWCFPAALEMARVPCAFSSGLRKKQERHSLQPKRVPEKLSPGLLTSTLFWEHDQGLCPFPLGPFLRRTAVVPAGGRRFVCHTSTNLPFHSFKYTRK